MVVYTTDQLEEVIDFQFDNSGKHCRFVLNDCRVTPFMAIDYRGCVKYEGKVVHVRLNESWCNGEYTKGLIKVIIDYAHSIVSITRGSDDSDVCLQGDEADQFIVELCNDWNKSVKSMFECVFDKISLDF